MRGGCDRAGLLAPAKMRRSGMPRRSRSWWLVRDVRRSGARRPFRTRGSASLPKQEVPLLESKWCEFWLGAKKFMEVGLRADSSGTREGKKLVSGVAAPRAPGVLCRVPTAAQRSS